MPGQFAWVTPHGSTSVSDRLCEFGNLVTARVLCAPRVPPRHRDTRRRFIKHHQTVGTVSSDVFPSPLFHTARLQGQHSTPNEDPLTPPTRSQAHARAMLPASEGQASPASPMTEGSSAPARPGSRTAKGSATGILSLR